MSNNCGGPEYCEDCPLLELVPPEFSEGDRLDAVNSVILAKQLVPLELNEGLPGYELIRLERKVKTLVGFQSEKIGRVAIKAFEKRLIGHCSISNERINNGKDI